MLHGVRASDLRGAHAVGPEARRLGPGRDLELPRNARAEPGKATRYVTLVGGVDPLLDAVDPDPPAVRDDALRIGVPEVQVEHRQRPGVVLVQHSSDGFFLGAREPGLVLGRVGSLEGPSLRPGDEDGGESLE